MKLIFPVLMILGVTGLTFAIVWFRYDQLAAEPEDLSGVAKGDLADIGQADVAAHFAEQLHLKGLLELADLGADRGR